MTQTSHLKAAQITALDATQPKGDVQSAGAGAPARTITISGSVTTVSADAAGSTYQLVRIPTTAIVKYVGFSAQAMTAGKVQLGVYYSDATDDGTPAALRGVVVPTVGVNFFANDIDCTSAVAQTDETFQNAASAGSYAQGAINKRLWDALGLTADPGGYFDIVATCHTTGITTGAPISLQVEYAE